MLHQALPQAGEYDDSGYQGHKRYGHTYVAYDPESKIVGLRELSSRTEQYGKVGEVVALAHRLAGVGKVLSQIATLLIPWRILTFAISIDMRESMILHA